jgi:hypothetical protein
LFFEWIAGEGSSAVLATAAAITGGLFFLDVEVFVQLDGRSPVSVRAKIAAMCPVAIIYGWSSKHQAILMPGTR